MAFETERGNVTRVDAEISAVAAPAFVEKSKALAHCAKDIFPANNDVKRFSKDGSFVAGTLAESSPYTFDSGDEFVESSVDVTAQTYVHIYKPTVQAERFASDRANPAKLGPKQGEALARALDATWLALISSFTSNTAIDAGAAMTKDALLDAQVAVHSALNLDEQLHVIMSRAHRNEIRKELTNTTATAFSQSMMLQTVVQKISPQGFVGEFSDMLVFNTSGLPTSGGDTLGLTFHPLYAFCMAYDPTVYSRGQFQASGGLFTELASWMFANVAEFVDAAGVITKADT